MSINIAIDGPAGAGKSSVAKALAKDLNYIYVDTGALYRAVAYHVSGKGADTKSIEQVEPLLKDVKIELKFIDGTQRVFLNGTDVSDLIRTPEISMGASNVSALPCVRKFLFELQRSIARENNVIMDGRDIGTVVLPDAQLKIFLTASPEERATRRFNELQEKCNCPTYAEVLADIKTRDYNDSHRATAPLKQADDAVLVDSTDMTFNEVTEKIKTLINGI